MASYLWLKIQIFISLWYIVSYCFNQFWHIDKIWLRQEQDAADCKIFHSVHFSNSFFAIVYYLKYQNVYIKKHQIFLSWWNIVSYCFKQFWHIDKIWLQQEQDAADCKIFHLVHFSKIFSLPSFFVIINSTILKYNWKYQICKLFLSIFIQKSVWIYLWKLTITKMHISKGRGPKK